MYQKMLTNKRCLTNMTNVPLKMRYTINTKIFSTLEQLSLCLTEEHLI